MNKKIVVLLSSYNGEKFIAEQIDSILQQEQVDVQLIVRDDGSTDATRALLKKYEKLPNVSVWYGDNVGVRASFMELVKNAPASDYYAFADQDDIWYKDKLIRGIRKIEKAGNDGPILYTSNQDLLDSEGNFIKVRFTDEIKQYIRLESMVYNNQISGCTFVYNNKLAKALEDRKELYAIGYERMHDRMMLLLALCCGSIIYDDVPTMGYRRHDSNVTSTKSDADRDIIDQLRYHLSNMMIPQNKNNTTKTAKLLMPVLERDKGKASEVYKNIACIAKCGDNCFFRIKLLFNQNIINMFNDKKTTVAIKIITGWI